MYWMLVVVDVNRLPGVVRTGSDLRDPQDVLSVGCRRRQQTRLPGVVRTGSDLRDPQDVLDVGCRRREQTTGRGTDWVRPTRSSRCIECWLS